MVFIVAELGTNWNGNPVILDRMVGIMKSFGVNAVKLQALSKDLIARHVELSWYKDASVRQDNVQFINNIISQYEMEWFCTPTYPEAVGFLDPYVKRYKIRHDDQYRHDIIEQCVRTGKETIVSVNRPNTNIQNYKNLKQIYCIAKYPTAYGELNFDMLKVLKGYSNHCLNPLACLKAVRMGAEYLEFHVTDDPDRFSIDNKVSFTYAQVQELMEWIRIYERNRKSE